LAERKKGVSRYIGIDFNHMEYLIKSTT